MKDVYECPECGHRVMIEGEQIHATVWCGCLEVMTVVEP